MPGKPLFRSFTEAIRKKITESSQNAGFEAVRRFASPYIPKCKVCGESVVTPLPCRLCGQYSCEDHMLYHISGFGVCLDCCWEAGMDFDLEEEEEEDEAIGFPWSELGIEPTISISDINKAYRKQAARLHPDRFRDQEQKTQAQAAFVRLNAAREEALRIVKGG